MRIRRPDVLCYRRQFLHDTTAEVQVTNIYRDELLKETDLPVKMTAYTALFPPPKRAAMADMRGLNRLHQFDKVK